MYKSNSNVFLSYRVSLLSVLFRKVKSKVTILLALFSLGLLAFMAPSLSVASSDNKWTTPNYPNKYADHADISQTIRVDGDSMVLIINGETEAEYDFIYINGEEYSGEFNNHLIAIDSNQVNIRFTSDYSIQRQGVSVKAVPGTLWTTPNHPRDYANFTDVSETISLPNADSIKLTLQGSTEQNYDFLTINGEKYHGQFNNLEINIPSKQVDIRFTSDYSVVKQGVEVLIEPVTKPLTDKELQNHVHRQLRAGLGEAATATTVAAGIGSICSWLGTFAMVDLEPSTKVTAAVADGACWLTAFLVGAGTYIVAKVSKHPESTAAAPHKVEKIEAVRPPIYDDGITQVTSIPIGNSYKIIRSSPSLLNSYVIDLNNDYYNDAKILAEHQGRSQEQQALSRLKRYMEDEDRRIASAPCSQPEPQSEPSNRRRLQINYIQYCLPPLPYVPDSERGNEVVDLQLLANSWQFQLRYDDDQYGGYHFRVGNYNQYANHEYLTLRLNRPGLLFDTNTNAFVLPGRTLRFGHEYKIINLSTLNDLSLVDLLPDYLQLRGTRIFITELDNINLYPMNNAQRIYDYYQQTLAIIPILASVQNDLDMQRLIELMAHFTNAYGLGLDDTQLTRRQLVVLLSVAQLLNAASDEMTESQRSITRAVIQEFRDLILKTNIIHGDCPIDVIEVTNMHQLRQKVTKILSDIYER